MKDLRIMLTGGGSGGHVFPLIAVAKELEKLAVSSNSLLELHYMGPSDSYGDIFSAYKIKTSYIVSAKIRRYISFANIIDIPKFFYSILQASWKMFFIMPDVVFSKGGPGALSVVIAAWFYRIPVIIHESDSAPGLTNLISRLFAKRVAVSFEGATKFFKPQITALTGNPVRSELVGARLDPKAAKEALALMPEEPLIAIIGGSQGSQRINEFILANLKFFLKEGAVIHQTGPANIKDVESLSHAAVLSLPIELEKKHPYRAQGMLSTKDMALVLSAADVVISRAGSGSIFELAAFEKPSILVPLAEAANDHQRQNAYEYSTTGAAIVIEEENLLPGIFMRHIREILSDPAVKERMSRAAGAFYKPQAAAVIAQEVLKLARE